MWWWRGLRWRNRSHPDYLPVWCLAVFVVTWGLVEAASYVRL